MVLGLGSLVAVAFLLVPEVAGAAWVWGVLALAGGVATAWSWRRPATTEGRGSRHHGLRAAAMECVATGVAFVAFVAAREAVVTRAVTIAGAAAIFVLLVVGVWLGWKRRWVDGGPRHLLPPALGLLAVTLLVVSVHGTLGLPRVAFAIAAVLFVTAATVVVGATGRMVAASEAPVPWHVPVVAPALVALAFFVWGPDTGTARFVAGLVLVGLAAAAFVFARPLDDPVRPGDSPVDPYIPWAERASSPWRRSHPKAFPFVVPLYLVVSWLLFVPFAVREGAFWSVPDEILAPWVYAIPDLTRDPAQVAVSLVTAQWMNHDSVQLVYVTFLLVLFGLVFEHQEGPWRTIVVFWVTAATAALVAGVFLHLVYPDLIRAEWAETAWERTWSGGSAGAFGIMGALAARARRPWPLLLFFVFWELNVGLWYLRSYTPAFHLPALATGALLTRYGLGRRDAQERSEQAS